MGADGKVVANVKMKPWYPSYVDFYEEVQALAPVSVTLTADEPAVYSPNAMMDGYFFYGASIASGTFIPPTAGQRGYVRFRGNIGGPSGQPCSWNFGPFYLPS